MKCTKCGFEFEGIFCPICGTNNSIPKVPWYLSIWFILLTTVLSCGISAMIMLPIRYIQYPFARKSTIITSIIIIICIFLLFI